MERLPAEQKQRNILCAESGEREWRQTTLIKTEGSRRERTPCVASKTPPPMPVDYIDYLRAGIHRNMLTGIGIGSVFRRRPPRLTVERFVDRAAPFTALRMYRKLRRPFAFVAMNTRIASPGVVPEDGVSEAGSFPCHVGWGLGSGGGIWCTMPVGMNVMWRMRESGESALPERPEWRDEVVRCAHCDRGAAKNHAERCHCAAKLYCRKLFRGVYLGATGLFNFRNISPAMRIFVALRTAGACLDGRSATPHPRSQTRRQRPRQIENYPTIQSAL